MTSYMEISDVVLEDGGHGLGLEAPRGPEQSLGTKVLRLDKMVLVLRQKSSSFQDLQLSFIYYSIFFVTIPIKPIYFLFNYISYNFRLAYLVC